MDEHYQRIHELSNEHIRLCELFIDALNENRPSEELSALKLQIRSVLETIEALEKQRGSNASLEESGNE